VTGITTPAKAI